MVSRGALGVAALAMAAVLLRGPRGTVGPNLVLLVVAFAALAVVVASERRHRRLSRGFVLGLSGALLVGAVAAPPTQSADVWSYAMYGRMVSEYQANPYRHTPAEYQADPVGRRVPRFWVESRSVYGPLFTGLSALGMTVAGASSLLARLFFQGLAALAVALALLLVDRRTRDPVALALVGVNPLTVISVVNGAHNDALVGLAVLAGVLLAVARRPGWAGAALAAGALVKATALFPLAALAAWLWFHDSRRSAVVVVSVAGAIGLGAVALSGGADVVAALGDAQGRVNGGSVWAWVHGRVSGPDSAFGVGDSAGRALSWLAAAAAAGLAVLLAVRRPRDEGPYLAAGAAVVAYLLVGTYVLPWYLSWVLPVLAVTWRWRVAWLVIAHAALLQLATARPPVQGPDGRSSFEVRLQSDLYEVVTPLFAAAVTVVLVVAMVQRLRGTPATGRQPRSSSATSNARSRA